MPERNQVAPDFVLQDQDGVERRLSDFRGRAVVLYFYPKDDTSGCTAQACDLRDRIDEIETRGATVLGVSPDPVKSHRRFADKYDLPFTLLADPDHSVAEVYGVWKEKSMYGRTYMGVERTTFLIGPDGRITDVLPRVKPATHVDQVLERI